MARFVLDAQASDSTTLLNIAFLLLAAALVVRFLRTGGMAKLKIMGGDDMPSHDMTRHGHATPEVTQDQRDGSSAEAPSATADAGDDRPACHTSPGWWFGFVRARSDANFASHEQSRSVPGLLADHFAVSIEHSTVQLEPVGHAGHEGDTHH